MNDRWIKKPTVSDNPSHRGIWARSRMLAAVLAISVLVGCVPQSPLSPDVAIDNGFLPSSAELIEQALESGEIDEPTSLLYRTWLFYEDTQLPDKFIGEDAPYEQGLMAHVRSKFDGLPKDIQAQIEPYLLRPDDPRSIFNVPAANDTDALSEPSATIALASTVQTVSDDNEKRCRAGWTTQALPSLGFRVWACNDPAALAGFEPEDILDILAGMLALYVPKMTSDFGEFIPDDPSMQSGNFADDLIDVYALPTGWHSPYRQNASQVPNFARTVQAPPFGGNTSSAFILTSVDHFDDMELFHRLLVHELFHAMHNTYNNGVVAGWWTEGVAEWAASYYVRSDSERLHHSRLEFIMDIPSPSILNEGKLSQYAGYIWPFFMEQEVGVESIVAVMRDLAVLPKNIGTELVISVLDKQLDMSANYPTLAVRLVNMQYPGNPISPRFQDLDANFPTSRHPKMKEYWLYDEPLKLGARGVLGLGYRDYYITVMPPDDHPVGTGVMVRISGQAATGAGVAPVLQAIVRDTDGEYSLEPITYTADGDTVCVDEEMILVLANISTEYFDMTNGELVLQQLEGEPCIQIDVNDPNSGAQLVDGDSVQIEGSEGDGQPDNTRLVVTVNGPDSATIDEYDVKVNIDGGTLRSPRLYSWPLSDFTDLGNGMWQKAIPLDLEIDLTDKNRPLTIDARVERKGKTVNSSAPTVELHAQQEAQCFLEATVVGQIMHHIQISGTETVYRAYPMDKTTRYEPPTKVGLASYSDYAGTALEIPTTYFVHDESLYEQDHFHFSAPDFGIDVPEGETGTFDLTSSLAYWDFTNVPWAKLNPSEDNPLPNMGRGQPIDAESILQGSSRIEITKNLTGAGILEGTIRGEFSDEFASNHGTRLAIEIRFATADDCGFYDERGNLR